jgi:hypothetical protein
MIFNLFKDYLLSNKIKNICFVRDLNPRPPAHKTDTLPTELTERLIHITDTRK